MIREARPTDRGVPAAGDGFVLVSLGSDGEVVGHVHARPAASGPVGRWHVEEIAVAPGSRRAGIGGDLLDAAESRIRDEGGSVLTVRTDPQTSWLEPFFGYAGYEVVESTRREDRVTMARRLVEPVVPRPAVSVIPLRDGAGGLEVFVQHRTATMDFAAGAVVFPGGRIDPADETPTTPEPELDLQAWSRTSLAADLPSLVATAHRAAVRELAEETGHVVDLSDLVAWDCWVTPAAAPRRFDVFFFVLACDELTQMRNTTTEAVRAGWEPVGEVLADGEEGLVRLMTPTRVILTELSGFASVAEAVAYRPEIVPGRRDGTGRRPRRDMAEVETGDRGES